MSPFSTWIVVGMTRAARPEPDRRCVDANGEKKRQYLLADLHVKRHRASVCWR